MLDALSSITEAPVKPRFVVALRDKRRFTHAAAP